MSDPFPILLTSAVTLGFVHTAIGIDHSMPFVVLARSRGWSLGRTLTITTACGGAHVLSSILISIVGLTLGVAGSRLTLLEQTRGNLAAWLLVGFGLAYAAVPLWKNSARRLLRASSEASPKGPAADPSRPSRLHAHFGADGADFVALPASRLMPALLVIFALGPCEALLPLLMAGGLSLSLAQSAAVALVFSLATVATMVLFVALGHLGTSRLRLTWLHRLETPTHVLSGFTLALSGAAIQFFGI